MFIQLLATHSIIVKEIKSTNLPIQCTNYVFYLFSTLLSFSSTHKMQIDTGKIYNWKHRD